MKDIFKSYDVRGKVGDELNDRVCNKIARVYADWLPLDGIIAVGYDMRPDSAQLAKAFIDGLMLQGRTVWDLGLITSDMAYFAVGKWDLSGAAVITASHNAGDMNGIKLYRDKVTAIGLGSGLEDIRDRVLADKLPNKTDIPGLIEKRDITEEWISHCLTFVKELSNFNIAIDAGNGMAGAILPKITPRLPITVEEMYYELDGTFPNHEANPMKPENVQDLAVVVKEKKLDFGIAFDGDGDRAGFVDDLGRPVLGTDLLTIVSKYMLDIHGPGEIVHEVRTSRATQELIKQWGGTTHRTVCGRVQIGAEVRKRGAIFGGETTGHFFYPNNYDADSGLIAALTAMQAITNSGKKLSELIDEYRLYAIIPETNFETTRDKESIFSQVKEAFPDGTFDMLDGLTVDFSDYWFNIRSSNTEPVMRLNAEAENQEKLDEVVKRMSDILKG